MAIEKFIPASPDLNLREDLDMAPARFGHLNRLVEDINANAVKPDGLNGYVQFNNNNALGGDSAFLWDNVNKRLGIGATPDIAKFQVVGEGVTSSTISLLVKNSAGTNLLSVLDNGNVGIGTNTPLYNLDVNGISRLGNTSFYATLTNGGADGGIFRVGGPNYSYAELKSYALTLSGGHNISGTGGTQQFSITSNVAPTAAQSNAAIKFIANNPGSAGGTWNAYSTALAFNFLKKETGGTYTSILALNGNTNNVGIGTITPTAKLEIKGAGTTSATNSLLVQNSASTETFLVRDDAAVKIGAGSFGHPVITRFQINDSLGNQLLRLDPSLLYTPSTIINSGGGFGLTISGNSTLTLKSENANIGFVTIGGNQTNSIAFTNDTRDFVDLNQNWNAVVGSSNLIRNALTLKNNINFTNSTGTNIARGLLINPTLTAVSDYRAIESNVGGAYFNTSSVNASAILQADSTTQGFLPPRMTTAQKLAIATPAAGLMVYDTDLNQMSYYNGTTWVNF
jgi:hypothetical protein